MQTYLVGGAVRDKLLHYPFHERDWVVVGATAKQLLEQGFQQVGKDFPVFLHPESKEEYALARTERKSAPGYTGFECHTSPDVTLEQDLLRRDLTINAIAQDSNGNIIDPYNGRRDLKEKILRHVSPAFTEDPLRVIRVARFLARYSYLGFQVAPETLQLMRSISDSGELSTLPAERIWKELQKALTEASPQEFFYCLKKTDALQHVMPDFCSLKKSNFQLLAAAAKQKKGAEISFALLFIDFEKNNAEALCRQITAPNQFRDLALLVSQYGNHCQQTIDHASQLLQLIEALDPFRQRHRFDQFLQCCELLHNNPRIVNRLLQAFQICQSITGAALAAEGLKGKAIAEELHLRRLQKINEKIF